MNRERLEKLLEEVRGGTVTPAEAAAALETLPFEDIGFAHVDHHRALREGFPEVVLGLGKSPEQVAAIGSRIAEHAARLLVTRATPAQFAALAPLVPDASYRAEARAIVVDRCAAQAKLPGVVVLCAGTADLPVAEEAAITAELGGSAVERIYDVGVAGLHRLLAHLDTLRAANALVVAAGMEGALPSVVSGLVAAPVIAVPTSIGYGASFGGLAALLGMLNSCSAGVAVVNIDNGFGAGYLAATINRQAHGAGRP
ncbi:MAG TPA: nickel pincer cofactor biosynthesis protein LarB [Dehalococcoidia bacterium]|nr:nickel pincer cofactor biosynthesis protein LarB [Dehalococcoidia bacterium]